MTRAQFFATFAAIPFIGKLFKQTHKWVRFESFGKKMNGKYYSFSGWVRSPAPDDIIFCEYDPKTDTFKKIEMSEPFIFKT